MQIFGSKTGANILLRGKIPERKKPEAQESGTTPKKPDRLRFAKSISPEWLAIQETNLKDISRNFQLQRAPLEF
jgi:hypothetical protein